MTEQNTNAEAVVVPVAKAIDAAHRTYFQEHALGLNIMSAEAMNRLEMENRIALARAAIAAHTAYLWQRASDPDVVEAVAQSLYNDTVRSSEFLVLPDGMTQWDRLPPQIQNEWKAMVRSARFHILTLLIGPRSESEEGR